MKVSAAFFALAAGILLTGCALSDEPIYAANDGYGYHDGPGNYGFYDPYDEMFFDDYGTYNAGLYGGNYGYGYRGFGLHRGRFGAGAWRGSFQGGFHGGGGLHGGSFHGGGFHGGVGGRAGPSRWGGSQHGKEGALICI
jgi:hypothetical protein